MNELVERFGTGRIEDLESQLIPKTQSRIADLRSEVEELENLGFGDVPAVEGYREQIQHLSEDLAGYRKELDRLRNGGDAGPSLGNSAADALRDAAEATRNGIEMPSRSPAGAQAGSQRNLIRGPESLAHVNLIQDMEFSGVQDSFSGIEKSVQQITDELPVFDKMMLSIGDSVRDVADTIENSIGDALENLIVRGESASDVFKQLAQDISAAILRQQVIDPAASAITSGISGLFPGGGAGDQVASTAQMQSMSFLPGRANGGNVYDGRPYMVGERGPELFVPSQDGQVTPNSRLGGGGDVTVNVINQSGDQMEAEQQQTRRGPNGEMTVDVMVKKSMERLDSQGQLDGIFRRHGARRQGQF